MRSNGLFLITSNGLYALAHAIDGQRTGGTDGLHTGASRLLHLASHCKSFATYDCLIRAQARAIPPLVNQYRPAVGC